MDGLKERVVVVTAGAANIGLAIAARFLDAGAKVLVCDVCADALAAASSCYPTLRGREADVGVPGQVEAFFEWVRGQAGEVDVLVNNAGIGGPRCPVDEIPYEEWRRTIEVNLNGMFYCTRQVVPAMKRRGRGVILNISTTSARTGLPNRAPYVASKAGVHGLTYNLARELGPFGIRCNAILPGHMDTPRGHRLVELKAADTGRPVAEVEAEALRFNSMRTWVQPSEVGDAAVFLASDQARHVSGQMLGVCGNAEWEG